MDNLLEKLFDHLDNFIKYERTKARRRLTDEDFTPVHIVNDVHTVHTVQWYPVLKNATEWYSNI